MIDGRRILAIVPARGGSKGLPNKNLQLIDGVSLVARTGLLVQRLPFIDRSVVSTESPEIRESAAAAGLSAPFLRPAELSGDEIGDLPVLAHALLESEEFDGTRYDIVVMLQPTCPLRTGAQVEQTIRKLIAEDLDSVWTVTETNPKQHPLKQLTLDQNGGLGHFDTRGEQIVARQQLSPVYHRNGAAYAMTRDCIVEQKKILGRRAGALIIREPLVNIDSLSDLELARRSLIDIPVGS